MFKKYSKKIIFILLVLLILIGSVSGWWYWQNKQHSNYSPNSEVFKLLDDKANLVYAEAVQLYPEARQQFEEKVKEIQSNLAKAGDKDSLVANYNNLGLYSSYLGNYREAFEAYLNSLNTIKDSRMTMLAFGELLVKMKAYKSAEAVFNKTNELNPWEAKGYIKLVNLYEAMADNKKIDEIYQTGLAGTLKNIDQNEYVLLLNDYADWLVSQKSYDQAIIVYQQIAGRQPQNKAMIDKKIADLKKLQQAK